MKERGRHYALPVLPYEDCLSRIVRHLRNAWARRALIQSQEPIELHVRSLIVETIQEANKDDLAELLSGNYERPQAHFDEKRNTAFFYEVAWDLFRRGILTPSPQFPENDHPRIAAGAFRVTKFGEWWLERTADLDVTPVEFTRFSKALDSHSGKLGDVFQIRSHEALRAYNASLHLACCVMVGAAAEAVLLELLAAKLNDRAQAEDMYSRRDGLANTLKVLVGKQPGGIQQDLKTYALLVKPWRDISAHASSTPIGEEHAYLSLYNLLRLAVFATAQWTALTT